MKPVALFSFAFLLATSAIAQQTITMAPPGHMDATRCPINLEATHGQGSVVLHAGTSVSAPAGPAIDGVGVGPANPQPKGLYQRLRLTLINPSAREIISAQLKVYGLSAQWRTTELAESANASDLSKKVAFTLDLKGNSRVSRDLSLSRFSAITSVELTSITYADGTAWHAPATGACTVTPDPLMLVSAAR